MHAAKIALGLGGVAMAVAVTATSVAVNEGALREARRNAERLGLDTIVLRDTRGSLTAGDAGWIAGLRPAVGAVSAVVRRAAAAHEILAVDSAYARVRPVALREGRFLIDGDHAAARRVCVVGARAAFDAFGHAPPVGRSLRIGRDWFLVVGVGAEGTGAEGEIFLPLSAYAARTAAAAPHQRVDELWVAAAGEVQAAEHAIRRALAAQPRLARVDVIVARDLLQARDRSLRMFTRITGLMGLLLFVLGGLAIANVMLTSVLERRSEIGVRRAVGATRRRIVLQFLREAALLAAAGAGLGIAGGVTLSALTARIAGWPAAFGTPAIIAIPAGAVAVGIAAAIYPALVAARMTPIEALMHE